MSLDGNADSFLDLGDFHPAWRGDDASINLARSNPATHDDTISQSGQFGTSLQRCRRQLAEHFAGNPPSGEATRFGEAMAPGDFRDTGTGGVSWNAEHGSTDFILH